MRMLDAKASSVVRARGGRGRRLDYKMPKALKESTEIPFNAAEQDNRAKRAKIVILDE